MVRVRRPDIPFAQRILYVPCTGQTSFLLPEVHDKGPLHLRRQGLPCPQKKRSFHSKPVVRRQRRGASYMPVWVLGHTRQPGNAPVPTRKERANQHTGCVPGVYITEKRPRPRWVPRKNATHLQHWTTQHVCKSRFFVSRAFAASAPIFGVPHQTMGAGSGLLEEPQRQRLRNRTVRDCNARGPPRGDQAADAYLSVHPSGHTGLLPHHGHRRCRQCQRV